MRYGTIDAANYCRGGNGRKLGMCLLRYDSTDSAAAAVHALHGHFLGEMDLEVEVCQYDIRRAQ
eukprot:13122387-Alexandrium_andersonii.AAC.1